ncbi:hypothetical protein ACFYZJ_14435 [Streptomyces sp. NPDC001848]|uniref:hypothetical protein n=1 Tax=Streptomyces sp. NPDC001848 TaxID=3364618 RepID=UPI0036ACF8D8
MPALSARHLASTAVCATLLLGITGPAAMAADHDAPRGRTHDSAPLPGPDVLLPRVQRLAEADRAVAPVSELLKAALTADNHRLPAKEAARLAKAAEDSITKITPPTPAPTVPIPARNDSQSDALAALRKAVDDLAAAATSGNAGQVLPAATTVLNKLINVLVASVTGAVTMPSLPSLPSLAPSLMPKPTGIPSGKPSATTPSASPTGTPTASSTATPGLSGKSTPSGTPTDPPQRTVLPTPYPPKH